MDARVADGARSDGKMRWAMQGERMSEHQAMKPRLLLVEDDPVSSLFMVAALEAMPAQVDSADCIASALSLHGGHDLWLLDANLPDGRGVDLLAELRKRSPGTPALAHTADDSPALHAQLQAAGFDAVLVKPLTTARLQQAVRGRLGLGAAVSLRVQESSDGFGQLPLWDHATALAALNGNQEHVVTLRGMFLEEVGRQHDDILSALQAADPQGAKKILHQLKASSGFVGALRLNAAAAALEKSLGDPVALERFSASVRETRA